MSALVDMLFSVLGQIIGFVIKVAMVFVMAFFAIKGLVSMFA